MNVFLEYELSVVCQRALFCTILGLDKIIAENHFTSEIFWWHQWNVNLHDIIHHRRKEISPDLTQTYKLQKGNVLHIWGLMDNKERNCVG